MSIRLQVEIDTTGAEQKLTALQTKFERRVYLSLVGKRLLAWIDQNFLKHGAENPWKPLSPNTLANPKRGVGAQPLRDTGGMAQSFVDTGALVLADSVTVGTEDRKAVWHHFGTVPYTIRPKNKKALAFPVAGVGNVVQVGRRFRRVVAAELGTRRAQFRGARGQLRTASARARNLVVVREVHHPGLPARPLLPSKDLARQLAHGVLEAYVEAVSQGQEPASG